MDADTIYHITSKTDWEAARSAGEYRTPSLDSEGFIHASTASQVIDTANRFYKGVHGLVLLTIDSTRVRAEIRYEAPAMPGHTSSISLFPHIYGALNLDAVQRVIDFPCDADGTFSMRG